MSATTPHNSRETRLEPGLTDPIQPCVIDRRPTESPAFHKANVLLVDDDPIVRKFLLTALTPEGYRLYDACDGLETILLWHERDPIDLIIMDVNMPGLEGPQLAELIWAGAYMPILYISGRQLAGLAERHVQDGRARFLAKPFRPGVLRKNVQELLEARRTFKAAR